MRRWSARPRNRCVRTIPSAMPTGARFKDSESRKLYRGAGSFTCMCGRFVSITLPDQLAAIFGTVGDAVPRLPPSYNVPPSREAYTVGLDPVEGRRGLAVMRWGLVPSWWQGTLKEAVKPSNARGETVATSPLFRDSFRSRRILVPADAFYEWRQSDRVPFAFRPTADPVFAFGGVWDEWTDAETGEARGSFAVVTTAPNEMMAPVHDRMPVVLAAVDWAAWLDPATPLKDARSLVRPYPAEAMTAYRVGSAVGRVRNDGPALLEPAAEGPTPMPVKVEAVDLFARFA